MLFETIGIQADYICLTVEGVYSFDRFLTVLKQAQTICHDHHRRKLLINLQNLSGPYPTAIQQHALFCEAQLFWDRRICIALLLTPQTIEGYELGVLAAQNRGLVLHTFDNEAEARAWLLKPCPDNLIGSVSLGFQ